MSKAVKLVFGGGVFGRPGGSFEEVPEITAVLDRLVELDVHEVDTALIYGQSEQKLGEADAGKKITIATKLPGGAKPGTATKEQVIEDGLGSLDRLKLDQVDIYYIHAPDASVPIASTLAGIDELHKRGAYKRFGISNYSPEETQAVYDHCKEHNYVLPTVYQGNYNAVARNYERTLFPLLRKLGIAFYAYSPIAGGFLAKSKDQVMAGQGRFDTSNPGGKMYSLLYARPALLQILSEWASIASEAGAAPAELAYRWVTHHSMLKPEYGDAVIFGSRSRDQVDETVAWVRNGPLPLDIVKQIDGIWEKVKHEAPTDNIEVFAQVFPR